MTNDENTAGTAAKSRFVLRHSTFFGHWSLNIRHLVRVIGHCAALLLLVVLYRSVLLPDTPGGDFVNHRVFGGRFLDHHFVYEGGLNRPYPPFWAMAHAPFALLPKTVAFYVYRSLGLGALLLLLALAPHARGKHTFTLFAVLIVARPFILRDLHDGGPNLIIVALAWSGMVLWSRGRGASGAACLGFAMALKCTPAIFLVYFAAKRQWRMLAGSAGMAMLFSLTPMLRQGPDGYGQHVAYWWNEVRVDMDAPPGWGMLGAEEMRNCSLRAALARQLVDLPEGHPGRLVHPWRLQLLNLPPELTKDLARLALGLLLGVVFVRLYGSGLDGTSGGSEREWAAMALLMPLLSPITWGQHCVATIPALVLLFDLWLKNRRRRDAVMLGLVSALYVVGLNRALVNANGAGLIASYGLLTFSLVMLLGACLRAAPAAPARPEGSG